MYGSQNTNPLFEKETEGREHTILPLQVIYDHQYGRWYVLGHVGGKGIMKFRMEGMTQLVEGKPVPEQFHADLLAVLEEKMRYSWLVDTGRPVKVRVRFLILRARSATLFGNVYCHRDNGVRSRRKKVNPLSMKSQ